MHAFLQRLFWLLHGPFSFGFLVAYVLRKSAAGARVHLSVAPATFPVLQHRHVQPMQHVVQHVVQNGVHCVVHVAVLVRVPHRSDGAPKICRVGPCNARVARPCLCRAPGHGAGYKYRFKLL
jgi:hypothetical protein